MASVIPLMPARKPDGLLTADELAGRWRLCVDTIYRLPPSSLPYIRIGRYRRYRVSDVEAYETTHREE